jgi:hypothetical protein
LGFRVESPLRKHLFVAVGIPTDMPIELSFFSYVNSLKVAVCELFVCFLKGSEVTKERERAKRIQLWRALAE